MRLSRACKATIKIIDMALININVNSAGAMSFKVNENNWLLHYCHPYACRETMGITVTRLSEEGLDKL